MINSSIIKKKEIVKENHKNFNVENFQYENKSINKKKKYEFI